MKTDPLSWTEETSWAGIVKVVLWEDTGLDRARSADDRGPERRPHSEGCREESQRGVGLTDLRSSMGREEAR